MPHDKEQYAALAAALIAVPESNEAMFTALGVDEYFAKWLVESGCVDVATFRELWTEYSEDERRPMKLGPMPSLIKLVTASAPRQSSDSEGVGSDDECMTNGDSV
jgi:hypothetical protein